MAGEIKLNNVSIATENAGTVTIAPNNVQFAANHAGIKTALNASGSAPVYACRAWVNFDGTGTVAIRDSGNVSSITDNGTGLYTVNLTTATPDSNCSYTASAKQNNSNLDQSSIAMAWMINTSSFGIRTVQAATAPVDAELVSAAIFR